MVVPGWQPVLGYGFLALGCVHFGRFVSALRRHAVSGVQLAWEVLSIPAFFIMGAAQLTGLAALFIAGVTLALASLAAILVQVSIQRRTTRQQ